MEQQKINQPSAAFISASWLALGVGILSFIIGFIYVIKPAFVPEYIGR